MEELFAKYQIKDEVVAVGVSGGADSLALVLQAAEELAILSAAQTADSLFPNLLSGSLPH